MKSIHWVVREAEQEDFEKKLNKKSASSAPRGSQRVVDPREGEQGDLEKKLNQNEPDLVVGAH